MSLIRSSDDQLFRKDGSLVRGAECCCCCDAVGLCVSVSKSICSILESGHHCIKILGAIIGWNAPPPCILDIAGGASLTYEVSFDAIIIISEDAVTEARDCEDSDSIITREELFGDVDSLHCTNVIDQATLKIYAEGVLIFTCNIDVGERDTTCDQSVGPGSSGSGTSSNSSSSSSSSSSSESSSSGSESSQSGSQIGGSGSGSSGGGDGSGGGGSSSSSGSIEPPPVCECGMTADAFSSGTCSGGTGHIFAAFSGAGCNLGCANGFWSITCQGNLFSGAGFDGGAEFDVVCTPDSVIDVEFSWACMDGTCNGFGSLVTIHVSMA